MWMWIWRLVNARQSTFVQRLEKLECEVYSMCQLISKMPGATQASVKVWAEREAMLTESPSDLAYMKEKGFL